MQARAFSIPHSFCASHHMRIHYVKLQCLSCLSWSLGPRPVRFLWRHFRLPSVRVVSQQLHCLAGHSLLSIYLIGCMYHSCWNGWSLADVKWYIDRSDLRGVLNNLWVTTFLQCAAWWSTPLFLRWSDAADRYVCCMTNSVHICISSSALFLLYYLLFIIYLVFLFIYFCHRIGQCNFLCGATLKEPCCCCFAFSLGSSL